MEWDLSTGQVPGAWDLNSCRVAFKARRLQEWIENFLREPDWENMGLFRRVRAYSVYWPAPVLMPISAMERVAGPGPEFQYPQDPVDWAAKVNAIIESNPQPDSLPPVICWRDPDGIINLADGNHRVSALEQLGYEYAWALVHDGPLRSEEEIHERATQTAKAARPKIVEGEFADIATEFRIFAEYCENSSDLYWNLTLKVSEDIELLALANRCRFGQPQPNMLFGAVHYLLLNGKQNALSRYYPSLTLEPEGPDHAFPAFKKFCLSHSEEIVELLESRIVQTNEVLRSAFLFPAFLTTSKIFGDKPLSLIEIGPSAGFNLLWDQYLYRYDEEEPVGLEGSSLTLTSSFRGDRRPDFTIPTPTIGNRIGIDLDPIDLMDRDQIGWLQALIWPEHFERKARLNKAIRIAMVNSVEIVQGDAIEKLPAILADVPSTEVATVYHTFVANQFSDEQRAALLTIIENFGKERDIIHLHNCIEPQLHATIYRNGERVDIPLAKGDPHARWIEWLA